MGCEIIEDVTRVCHLLPDPKAKIARKSPVSSLSKASQNKKSSQPGLRISCVSSSKACKPSHQFGSPDGRKQQIQATHSQPVSEVSRLHSSKKSSQGSQSTLGKKSSQVLGSTLDLGCRNLSSVHSEKISSAFKEGQGNDTRIKAINKDSQRSISMGQPSHKNNFISLNKKSRNPVSEEGISASKGNKETDLDRGLFQTLQMAGFYRLPEDHHRHANRKITSMSQPSDDGALNTASARTSRGGMHQKLCPEASNKTPKTKSYGNVISNPEQGWGAKRKREARTNDNHGFLRQPSDETSGSRSRKALATLDAGWPNNHDSVENEQMHPANVNGSSEEALPTNIQPLLVPLGNDQASESELSEATLTHLPEADDTHGVARSKNPTNSSEEFPTTVQPLSQVMCDCNALVPFQPCTNPETDAFPKHNITPSEAVAVHGLAKSKSPSNGSGEHRRSLQPISQIICDNNPLVPSVPLTKPETDTIPKPETSIIPKPKRRMKRSSKFPKDAPSLLVTGILDGVPVFYYDYRTKVKTWALIKQDCYLCGCKDCRFLKPVTAYNFVGHCNFTFKRANRVIYFKSGFSVGSVVKQIQNVPPEKFFETLSILTDSAINEENFRAWNWKNNVDELTQGADNGTQNTKPVKKQRKLTQGADNGTQNSKPVKKQRKLTQGADNGTQNTKPVKKQRKSTQGADNGTQNTKPVKEQQT